MSDNYITEVDILDEAKDCFLTYASEVLTDRAIPAAEDGLLSSQRKILWTMEDVLKNAVVTAFKNEYIIKEMDKIMKMFDRGFDGEYTQEELDEIRKASEESV